MRILSFHLKGKMAHFRRYYTNSSALSYTVPPRTTITGIIAGLLGKERDSYYSLFALDQCHIAIAVCSPVKKTIQKMNLLMIKGLNDLNGSQENHSQTATEFIIPQNIRTDSLDYQIWFHHKDAGLMDKLADLISNYPAYQSKGIALSLGAAFNLGWLEVDGTELIGETMHHPTEVEHIASIIPSAKLKTINIGMMKETRYALVKENLPLEFDGARRLTVKGIGSFIISLNGDAIPAIVESAVKINNGKVIVWME